MHDKTAGAWSPATSRLLSICCCAACQTTWIARGLDPGQVIADLRTAVWHQHNPAPDVVEQIRAPGSTGPPHCSLRCSTPSPTPRQACRSRCSAIPIRGRPYRSAPSTPGSPRCWSRPGPPSPAGRMPCRRPGWRCRRRSLSVPMSRSCPGRATDGADTRSATARRRGTAAQPVPPWASPDRTGNGRWVPRSWPPAAEPERRRPANVSVDGNRRADHRDGRPVRPHSETCPGMAAAVRPGPRAVVDGCCRHWRSSCSSTMCRCWAMSSRSRTTYRSSAFPRRRSSGWPIS